MVEQEYESLKKRLGTIQNGTMADGCPDIRDARNACEAVLTLSSTSNGKIAVRAWKSLEKQTNLELKDLAEDREDDLITFDKITAQPQTVITSPVFSGSEKDGRRYSPFTTNVERMIPYRTITGRQSFFVDHEMMKEFGEAMAIYKPILNHKPFRFKSTRCRRKRNYIKLFNTA